MKINRVRNPAPLLLLFVVASAFAQQSEQLELTEVLPPSALQSTNTASAVWRAANLEVSGQQERVLRWNLITVSDPLMVIDREKDVARTRIRLTVMPGVSFIAEHTNHRIRPWSMTWFGKIVAGGSGTVRISVVPDEDKKPVIFANIHSSQGDFNIWPTETRPYAIAVEANRSLRELIDSN